MSDLLSGLLTVVAVYGIIGLATNVVLAGVGVGGGRWVPLGWPVVWFVAGVGTVIMLVADREVDRAQAAVTPVWLVIAVTLVISAIVFFTVTTEVGL
jgi:hypothetical protein